MMGKVERRLFGLLVLCWAVLGCVIPITASAQDLDGREIVARVENLLWGKTSEGSYEMAISTPYWQRTLSLQVWMKRPDKSFVRITAPAKEAGVGSLRIEDEMWNYLPKVERTVKIPPSMMLQPWMGSDFTNDDLVKESSMINDYTHRLVATEKSGGEDVYKVESLPKPDAAVVWGKLIYRVRKRDLMPLAIEYYDERGSLVKALSFSEVREMSGRRLPTRWEMRPTGKPGNVTEIRVKDVAFDRPLPESIFTLRNLRTGR